MRDLVALLIPIALACSPARQASTPVRPETPGRSCALAGTVVLEGAPVTYYGVTIAKNYLAPFHAPATPVQDRDGRFCVPRLATAVFDLIVAGPGFAPKVIRGQVYRGHALDLGTIRVIRGRSIEGRVSDEAGKPVAEAIVRIGSSQFMNSDLDLLTDLATGSYSAVTDSTGYYRIDGLSNELDGLRMISAALPGRKASGPRRFDPDDRVFDVRVRPVGAIEGTVTGVHRPGETTDLITATLESDPDVSFVDVITADGRFQIDNVPEGTYEVSVSSMQQRVTVTAGNIAVATFVAR
jgi:hypothetical protein